jgi:hypothetical protein
VCEALYLALPSSHHLMRISGSIVTPQTLFPGAVSVNAATPERSLSVTTNFGVRPFFLRGSRISPSAAVAQALDQHVEDLAFLIDLCERFLPVGNGVGSTRFEPSRQPTCPLAAGSPHYPDNAEAA